MATAIESTGTLERKLKLVVVKSEVSREVGERLKKLSRTVKMAGFRPGKVPLKMVERSYGAQVHTEVLGEAVTKAFNDAVGEHKLRVAGEPRIEVGDVADASAAVNGAGDVQSGASAAVEQAELAFTASFEVYPEVQCGDPASLQVERFICDIGDAEIQKTLDVLRKQRASWNEVNREATAGDRATIDFVGTLDGTAFQGGTASDFSFELGEGRMLADFESGVRGMRPGEERKFPVAFPADYGSAELAGKTAEFQVTLKKLAAPELPEVNADFATQLGVADGDVERLRGDIKANLEREVAQRLRARTKTSVMSALPALATFELPKALVQSESEAIAERMKADLQARGMDVRSIPVPPEAFRDQAEKRVRLGLLVAEVVQKHSLQAKPDQIRKQIEEFAQAYENPGEVIRHYFSDRNRLAEVEALVVEQNVVDWVLSKSQVSDKPLAFDELMAQQQG
jgi:trigger factor